MGKRPMKQDIGKRLLYKFLFKLGSHNNVHCVTYVLEGERPQNLRINYRIG